MQFIGKHKCDWEFLMDPEKKKPLAIAGKGVVKFRSTNITFEVSKPSFR